MSGTQLVDVPIGTAARLTGRAGSSITYRSEADLRDALAAWLWFDGWDVEIEVPVATGGRADVVARTEGYVICFELKVNLKTQRQLRLGFQQADGYRRHFEAVEAAKVLAVLTAPSVDWTVSEAIEDLYPQVRLRDYSRASAMGETWNLAGRTRLATQRLRSIEHLQAIGVQRQGNAVDRLRIERLQALYRNYPAMAETLAGALGKTFRTAS